MNETSFAHILFVTGVPGKLFDKLRAVSFIERPRRTCPVLTGRVEDSLISQIITIFNQD
jgi:hypothetical protein